MFDRLFMDILDMSKTAAIVIAAVLLARLFLRKAPKVFSFALWAVVLFRLLCPFSLEAPVSIMPQLPATSSSYTLADEPIDFAGAGMVAYQAIGDAVNGEPEIHRIPTTETSEMGVTRYVTADWRSLGILFGKYVWAAGVAFMLLYSLIAYRKVRKDTKIAVPLRDNIWIADDIQSPFVIGFTQPKIYLPCNLSEKEQEYIILHEQHHIRRFDHIFKAAAFLALTIHWFNPLVWVAFVLACKDMEMSCDEAVIRKLGGEVRADYSASLLTLATGRRIIAGTPLAFGEGDTRDRIKNLAKWKKPAIWIVVIVAVLCIILAAVLLTDPEEQVTGPMPGMDAQNKYGIFSVWGFQESETFYCGGVGIGKGNLLYYYDKETGNSGLLCADPACTHDSSACGAYVEWGAKIFLHGGKRYWITNDFQTDGADFILRRGEISGINRQKIKIISLENIIIPYSPQQYAVHRGNLYFVGYTNRVHGVQTGNRLTLMQSPLDETEEFTALFDKTYEADVHFDVRYIGDHAFLLVQLWNDGNTSVDIELYRIALSDGEAELLFETADVEYIDGFWVTEQEEVYLIEWGNGTLFKLLNGKPVWVAAMKHTEYCKLMDGIAVSYYVEDEERCVEIMDFDGNLIYDGVLFTEEIPEITADPKLSRRYGMTLIGGDRDKLIIGLELMKDLSTECYTIEVKISEGMKPTLLWKQE